MDEAQLAQNHELWFEGARDNHERQQQILAKQGRLWINGTLLMLWTLEPHRLEALLQKWKNLPPGSMHDLYLNLCPSPTAHYCRNLPSEEAVLATATKLARILSSIDSIESLFLYQATTSIASAFLTELSRLELVAFDSCELLTTATMQSLFSIKTLRKLEIRRSDFPDSESIAAFCFGVENSSLETLLMFRVSLTTSREQNEQVAAALARCKTLVHFDYLVGASPSFCICYHAALANNVDTKLEQLCLYGAQCALNFRGAEGTAEGVNAATVAKIRNLLKCNVQRKNCPPLFAAIGTAETDATRKQCLVEAMDAVDIPVLFEYISTNQSNIIALIQKLGRNRKRRRED